MLPPDHTSPPPQPISAAAITQMAITANIVFCGEACTMAATTGADHTRDQATVRHGTNQRDSGGILATAATRNGVTSMAASQAGGTVCTGWAAASAADAVTLVASRLLLM